MRLVLRNPQRNFTPHGLSKLAGVSYATTWRYVHELENSGIISIEKIGKYNVCKLNESSPMIPRLKSFLEVEALSLGPEDTDRDQGDSLVKQHLGN